MEQERIEEAKCELCGEPMPKGEEMFKYHGYSGPCPKPPLQPRKPTPEEAAYARGLADGRKEAARAIVALREIAGIMDDPRWDDGREAGPRAMLDTCIGIATRAAAEAAKEAKKP